MGIFFRAKNLHYVLENVDYGVGFKDFFVEVNQSSPKSSNRLVRAERHADFSICYNTFGARSTQEQIGFFCGKYPFRVSLRKSFGASKNLSVFFKFFYIWRRAQRAAKNFGFFCGKYLFKVPLRTFLE